MQINISSIHKVFENPNWKEADQLAFYKAQPKSWTWGHQEQIQWVAGQRTWTWDHQIIRPGP